ncbi:2-oxoglutarate (2OG) and Fe(II)-dependent oxygenase superfamily protein [Euphorbia peplus]|nr:2-oxoglutarate (2OG) and Fe(II)-dependent oxygenase superfamily protein [Euphorbia peplus]
MELQIPTFEKLPSTSVFSEIESKNIPAVFQGCVNQWKAFTRWNPLNRGLDYLQARVGSLNVEAMLSRTPPVFYGDLRSHERVPLPFSAFIQLCKQRLATDEKDHCVMSGQEDHDPLLSGVAPEQIYLAQVPIMNIEDQERVQLANLWEDIQVPAFLETKELASVNLWMNNANARSSTHYDPHHNILCVVAGQKEVVLWPPSASPFLYPMPLYGEASNHSSVALENPDLSLYPRAEIFMEYSQKVILHAGDALFIPEGWYHQVDSEDLTIAVNIWWRSNIMSSMSEHMDSYYLRRILRRLTDKEMDHILSKTSSGLEKQNIHSPQLLSSAGEDQGRSGLVLENEKDLLGKEQQQRLNLHVLEPFTLQALHKLVSLVHDRINMTDQSQSEQSTSAKVSAVDLKVQHNKTVRSELFLMEDDPVAKALWTLDPHTLQNVLLAIAHNFPRTLEALVLHLLSPVGAEILTKKFEEMDKVNSEEDRNKFYQVFYGVFDDQLAAMDAILKGKELFALKAFKNVLDKYVGVKI